MKSQVKKDLLIILAVSFVSAAIYLTFGSQIMDYGRNIENPIGLRFLPVVLIQFGMSGLGISIVLIRNRESLVDYGLKRKKALLSIGLSLVMSIPTMGFLYFTNDLNGFLPFQGMFLTKEILDLDFPLNLAIYLLIAIVWGFGEGLFYLVLSDKISQIVKPVGLFNLGDLVCGFVAILIHGMVGFDLKTLAEGTATFVMMYGSLLVREKTGNGWGTILIFFLVWNCW